jgi:hypothetical protein
MPMKGFVLICLNINLLNFIGMNVFALFTIQAYMQTPSSPEQFQVVDRQEQ